MNKAIVIFGPTSSGKTDLSIQLADYLQSAHSVKSEIISTDARQLYRHMDIGTAKTSSELRSKHPHHFIDILDPDERYSSRQFVREAGKVMDQIFARGNIAMLVGGTGTVVMGLVGARHLQGAEDPELPFETLFLIPQISRADLYRRIERSVDEMFHKGLYREVKQIISHHGSVPWQLKVTHGYRQFVEYAAKNHQNVMNLNRSDLEKIKQQVKVHTKKYAMHQLGWIKKLHHYHLVENVTTAKLLVSKFSQNTLIKTFS